MAKKEDVKVLKRKTKAPEFLTDFYKRDGTREARSLHKAVNYITTNGVRTMDRTTLKQVGLPLIREVKIRMRLLEEAGLTDSPAYQYIKDKGINISTGGTNLNTIRQNVMECYNFLHSKTSLVEYAQDYNDWLDDHLGFFTTKEQRESIWDIVHKFEDSHPGAFMNYGYDEAIRKISQVSDISSYSLNELLNLEKEVESKDISDMIGRYLSERSTFRADDELKKMLEQKVEQLMLRVDKSELELDKGGLSGWYKGRSSMDDF